jgi:RNA polymerase sigma factor for flagellar operon FliA
VGDGFDPKAFAKRRPLALKIARGVWRKLPQSVLREDVEQAALIGLWDALTNRTDDSTPAFEGYVRLRIRGAVMDELRHQDWLPRKFRQKYGKAVSLVRFGDIGDSGEKIGWEERLADLAPSPEDVLLLHSEASEALLAPLDPLDRRVVELVIYRGVAMKAIGRELGFSEPRVSQRFARAIETMRLFLTGKFTPTTRKESHLSEEARSRILEAKEGRQK